MNCLYWAKMMRERAVAYTVDIVIFPEIDDFMKSVPRVVFEAANSELFQFALRYVSVEMGWGHGSDASSLPVSMPSVGERRADLVIVPSWKSPDDDGSSPLTRYLKDHHAAGSLIAGLCLGTFPVAEAGLIDGRSAVTHWCYAAEFEKRFPAVSLHSDRLYVDEGDVITAAGVAGAFDACIYIVGRICGQHWAREVSRRLVLGRPRSGSEPQADFGARRTARQSERLLSLIETRKPGLIESPSLDAAATSAGMSRRSFSRHFRATMGMSFVQWQSRAKVNRAKALLEASSLSVEDIAVEVGFETTSAFRQAFTSDVGMPPGAWRKAFQAFGRQS